MATKTKIAVLDDYQEISKRHFSKLDPLKYEVTYFPDTLPAFNGPQTSRQDQDELVQRLSPFHIISTMRERTPFAAALIQSLPDLKLLLTTGARNLGLDLQAFQAQNVPVAGTVTDVKSRTAEQNDSTTEHCIAMILSLVRNIPSDDLSVKSGGWQLGLATALAGKTLGVVGLGRLGMRVAKILSIAFGMRVTAWSENLTQDKADEKVTSAGLQARDAQGNKRVQVVSREELFSEADVISIHLILSDRTRHLISKSDLERMKPTSFLVNTSRGPITVENDLLDVLEEGKIRGAALDVFDIEPLAGDSRWRSLDWGKNGKSRVVLTPHMGYVEEQDIDDWYAQQVRNIERWEKGEELQVLLK